MSFAVFQFSIVLIFCNLQTGYAQMPGLVCGITHCHEVQGICDAAGTCWCEAGFGGIACDDTCNTTAPACDDGLCTGTTDALCKVKTACPASPCVTGQGTCKSYDVDDSSLDVQCQCESNFAGETCNTCAAGLYGTACSERECNATGTLACQNGGTCGGTTSDQCDCASGFGGDLCQLTTPECVGGCLNGGTCTDNVGVAECSCAAGYHGTTCSERECSATVVCQNEGTCDTVTTQQCTCDTGYTGDLCQLRECSTTLNCENGGTCGATDSLCSCATGYGGDLCELRECSLTLLCTNGGTCGADNLCVCPTDYSGDLCQSGAARVFQAMSLVMLVVVGRWFLA